MPPAPRADVPSIPLALRPQELLAAWRPETGRLHATTSEPVRRDQRVVTRLTLVGVGIAVTVGGRIASATARDGQIRFELSPDETRVRALERLVEIARGAAVAYPPRAPRYLATVPAIVNGPGGVMYMNTFSVSERGCGLAWSGPMPVVGASLELRLGAGKQIATLRGIVCWSGKSGRAATVGVRFVTGHTAAWATIFQDVRRSGAPPA